MADSVRMFPFPVNPAPPSPAVDANSRLVVGEVDFFSDHRNGRAGADDPDSKALSIVAVKKENNSYGEVAPRSTPDHVNVR